jgi:hypothetical protein
MYSNEMSENLTWFSSNISNYIHAMICCNDSVINNKVILMNDEYVFSKGGWIRITVVVVRYCSELQLSSSE